MESQNFDARVNNFITVSPDPEQIEIAKVINQPEPPKGFLYSGLHKIWEGRIEAAKLRASLHRLQWALESLKYATEVEAYQFIKDNNLPNILYENANMGWKIDLRSDSFANKISSIGTKIISAVPVIGQLAKGIGGKEFSDTIAGVDSNKSLSILNLVPKQTQQQIENVKFQALTLWDQIKYKFSHLQKFPK